MKYIKADQIKGARAMLGWTREELAEASGLSHNTIRNLEMGFISPRGKTLEQLCHAVEEAGLEFTEDEGIRRFRPDIKIIEGSDSREIFFDIMLRTAKIKGGEIVGIFNSQSMIVKALGTEDDQGYERLKKLLVHADMKYLISEMDEGQFPFGNCRFRMPPKYCNSSTRYFVYGNSFALVQPNCCDNYRFVVFNDVELALGNKAHFNLIWDIASPFHAPIVKKEINERVSA